MEKLDPSLVVSITLFHSYCYPLQDVFFVFATTPIKDLNCSNKSDLYKHDQIRVPIHHESHEHFKQKKVKANAYEYINVINVACKRNQTQLGVNGRYTYTRLIGLN